MKLPLLNLPLTYCFFGRAMNVVMESKASAFGGFAKAKAMTTKSLLI
jgi:hypothetical protein